MLREKNKTVLANQISKMIDGLMADITFIKDETKISYAYVQNTASNLPSNAYYNEISKQRRRRLRRHRAIVNSSNVKASWF